MKHRLNEIPPRQDHSPVWHMVTSSEACEFLGVEPDLGLSQEEAASRISRDGLNILEEESANPPWMRFLEQYKSYMQIVLVIAAVVSLYIAEYSTFFLLLLLTVFNASLGYRQEEKAAASVAALNRMMKVTATVRRDGTISRIDASRITVGDIVIVDAGDRVPADGRVILSSNLQIEESALTGESTPVEKKGDPIPIPDLPLGDRVNLAYMNTNVTRGHGEILVTGTGMQTEVGHIATMLKAQTPEKTPLTRQIDQVTLIIIGMAVLAFLSIVIIGLSQGQPFSSLFNIGVSLAIGSIPDALPAVVISILAIGTVAMADRNAIIKSLPAGETLGSTSCINSDKTGTLTMNQMTVRVISTGGHRYSVTGEGYASVGMIQRTAGDPGENLDHVLFPCALCTDAEVRDGQVVGDPTEGALYVLAEKGGLNVGEFRKNYPRIASIPFDSEYKFMATFHEMKDTGGKPVIRAYAKGAPDVILARSRYGLLADRSIAELTAQMREVVLNENDRIAGEGLRVLAFAQGEYDPAFFHPEGDLMPLMNDLIITALVGEVDPPRPEAKSAIEKAHRAGIQVRVITGDHAVTAGAIGKELGITGRAITSAEFAAMSDEEASDMIDEIGVIARVAPEHKVRLVNVLRKKGHIVAMTGDGVNDAPALKAADIGIAMGACGTDVAKGAAKMILTDDNFATIVAAIEEGRKIYDNLQKFLRIQIANLFMFILAFLGSSLFAIAGTALFTPGQVLWIHMLTVAPIGAALGLDIASPGIMTRKPRRSDDPIISRAMYVRLCLIGLFMAGATLWIYRTGEILTGSSHTGQTMALAAVSLMNIGVALNLRFPSETAFQKSTFSNPRLLYAFAWVFIGTMMITETRLFQTLFHTVSLTADQWLLCLVPGIILFSVGELFKAVSRRRMTSSSGSPA